MSAYIPDDAERLVDRLRMAADEIESAARYGIPIPFCLTISGHQFSGVSISVNEAEFSAWVEYAEAAVEDYEHEGVQWSRATADINGLPISFAVSHTEVEATS